MRPRYRKISYDFRSNPSRSILVILSIFVGLFAIGMIMSLWICIPSDMRNGYLRSNPANLYFRLSNFDNALIRSVEKWPNVKSAMGSSVENMRVWSLDQTLHKVTVQAVSDDSWPVNHIEILEGKWPLDPGEAALENYKFEELGLQIGDDLVVKTNSGSETRLKLTTRVRDQSIGAGDYSIVFLEPINMYIHENSLRKLEMDREWNLLRVSLKSGGTDKELIKATGQDFGHRLEKAGYTVDSTAIRLSDAHPTADYANAIAGILLLIGILVLFLSSALTYNTLTAILSNQMRQIGAMKTVGATYRQIVLMYMRLIFYYSIIALVLAIPSSILASNVCRQFLSDQINFDMIRQGVIWETIVVQVVLGLIVPQIAGAVPVSAGARVSIQRAMSGVQMSGGDVSRPGHFMKMMSRLFSRPTALSMRNTFRNKKRLALTLFTLSLGGAIFIGSFNVNTAIDEHIAVISRYVQADLDVVTDTPYRLERVSNALKEVEGVRYVEGWGFGTAKFIDPNGKDGPSISIFAPPDGSELIQPNVKTGRWFEPGEKNVITLSERFNYDYPDLQVGDTIKLEVDGTDDQSEWTVIGFYTMAGKSGGFMGYMPLSSWKDVSGFANRIRKFQVVTTSKLDDPSRNEMSARIEKVLEDKGFNISAIQRNDTFVQDAAGGLDILSIFMLIMALLVALVGCIGLAGTMSLNVMERTSEIGILRAIGASNHAVMKNVLTEGLLIGVMSWLLGSLLSVPVGILLTNSMGQAIFGSNLAPGFTWVGYVLWLGVSILLSIAASSAPARTAERLTIQEVLSVE